MSAKANVSETAVFKLIASDLKKYVITVKIMIPAVNDMNLPGQNIPSNPRTTKLVASINNHVSGTPSNINENLCCFAHGHSIGPLVWIQTIA